MIELIPLCSGVVEVAPGLAIGNGPSGTRSVSAITAAGFAGDRLRAEQVGPVAADWMLHNAVQAIGKGTIALKDGAARIDYQFFALG